MSRNPLAVRTWTLFPRRAFAIETAISVDEVEARLRAATRPVALWLPFAEATAVLGREARFVGRVGRSGFEIRLAALVRGGPPMLVGVVDATASGAVVSVVAKIPREVELFLSTITAGVVLGDLAFLWAAPFERTHWIAFALPFVMIVFVSLVTRIGFDRGAATSRAALIDTLSANSPR